MQPHPVDVPSGRQQHAPRLLRSSAAILPADVTDSILHNLSVGVTSSDMDGEHEQG